MSRRRALVLCCWILTLAFFAHAAWAQDSAPPADGAANAADSAWPYHEIDPDYFRGPGFYLSTGKIATCWFLFLVWVRTTDWINQDLQMQRLKIHLWNPVVVGSFSFAFLLVWLIPNFWIGFVLMLVAYAGPLGSYVYYRNGKVADHEKVLTPAHLRFWFSEKLKVIGIKIEAEKQEAQDKGPALQLVAKSGPTEQDDQAKLILARQLPGYTLARTMLFDADGFRADAVLLDLAESTSVRYQIDGVWHNHEPQSREKGDEVVQVLKAIAGLDADAQVAKQAGRFGAVTEQRSFDCNLTAQMQGAAQRMLIQFQRPASFESLEELGMRPKTVEHLKQLILNDKGIMLFSSLPAGGVTTTLDTLLQQVDRFLRDFVSVEDKARRENEIQNVDVKTYNAAGGEKPATILPTVNRTQPDVIVCRNMVDADSARMLCEMAQERLIMSTIAAKDAAEALLRVLAMKVSPGEFAPVVIGVLHQRLIRKVCETCRQPYAPSPELLKKLGIPAGKVETLYRAKTEGDDVCKACKGLGYFGRTAIFELLEVDDTSRKVLKSKPQLDLLRKAARQAKMISEQEHGILLVAQGITTIEELQRVLKS